MMTKNLSALLILLLITIFFTAFFNSSSVQAYQTKRVIIVVIDGVRHLEAFKSASDNFPDDCGICAQFGASMPYLCGGKHSITPLRESGSLYTRFYNNGMTVTTAASQIMFTGIYTLAPNLGELQPAYYEFRPFRNTIFEAYEKFSGLTDKAACVVSKHNFSRIEYSLDPLYGKDFKADLYESNQTESMKNQDVYNKARDYLWGNSGLVQPNLFLIHFGPVDYWAHRGRDYYDTANNQSYVGSLREVDNIIYKLWKEDIQNPDNSYYYNRTTLFVLTDHGRDMLEPDPFGCDYNWFCTHGGLCRNCRYNFLLVLGPQDGPQQDIRKNFIDNTHPHDLLDLSATVSELLGFREEVKESEGRVMTEMFASQQPSNLPTIFRTNPKIVYADGNLFAVWEAIRWIQEGGIMVRKRQIWFCKMPTTQGMPFIINESSPNAFQLSDDSQGEAFEPQINAEFSNLTNQVTVSVVWNVVRRLPVASTPDAQLDNCRMIVFRGSTNSGATWFPNPPLILEQSTLEKPGPDPDDCTTSISSTRSYSTATVICNQAINQQFRTRGQIRVYYARYYDVYPGAKDRADIIERVACRTKKGGIKWLPGEVIYSEGGESSDIIFGYPQEINVSYDGKYNDPGGGNILLTFRTAKFDQSSPPGKWNIYELNSNFHNDPGKGWSEAILLSSNTGFNESTAFNSASSAKLISGPKFNWNAVWSDYKKDDLPIEEQVGLETGDLFIAVSSFHGQNSPVKHRISTSRYAVMPSVAMEESGTIAHAIWLQKGMNDEYDIFSSVGVWDTQNEFWDWTASDTQRTSTSVRELSPCLTIEPASPVSKKFYIYRKYNSLTEPWLIVVDKYQ